MPELVYNQGYALCLIVIIQALNSSGLVSKSDRSMQRVTPLYPAFSRTVILILAVLFVVTLVARIIPGPRTIDDAFITFRYSRNIVEGHGFLYNPGQPATLGTTTPLFTLLMAGMSLVTGGQDFPWYALSVSALADGITVMLLYLLARRFTRHDIAAIIPAALYAIAPMSVTFAVGGMETSLNILWMLAATTTYVLSTGQSSRRSAILVGLFAGLGFLTRVDSAIWIGLLFVHQLVERVWQGQQQQTPWLQRIPWTTWITFGVVTLPWMLFSLLYFGAAIPNTISAKTVAYLIEPGSALVRLIQAYSTLFFEDQLFTTSIIALTSLLYLVLSILAITRSARLLPRLVPFLVYPWVYITIFSIANPLIFRWYMAPFVPALILGLFIGVWCIITGRKGRVLELKRVRWGIPVLAIFTLFWGASSLNAWTWNPDHGNNRPAPTMAWHKIELLYQEVGTALRDVEGVQPTTIVASGDIGAIGYFSRAIILDTVGLVTPAVRNYYPVSPDLVPEGQNYAIPPALILDAMPEYLVAMESMVRLGLQQDPTFNSNYELIREIPTDFYGTGMVIYRRINPAAQS
jgi:4-amino-4-deoxy-L-arabinose transferase-like glycosyltransferase